MVKLLIDLHLEIQKNIREIHQMTQWMQDQNKWKTL